MNKIYAKNTVVKEIENELSDTFVKDNHNQRTTNSVLKIYSFGLFYNDELVGVAQFCAPRTSKKQREYSTELLRLAFKKNVRVVGGASKLVKYFINKYDPSDIFTYQDATGENTDVYEKSGFTFVSQEKKKEYLVAPGKTIETGSREEVLGMPYATQYGPDRILGTKLGEIIDPETGKRKSNKRIFIEELGWHIETTPGDKVYEWFNPNHTHYVYKTSAVNSDKYYYGVSHVKIQNATEEDCLNDGYYGSGGTNKTNKFKNWKEKHKNELKKEILQIFSKKSEAYIFEKEIIGDLYKNDPLCLNSTSGGKTGGMYVNAQRVSLKTCPVHGETKHQGSSCSKCSIVVTVEVCEIHGQTKHRGDKCFKCFTMKSIVEKVCDVHGRTSYRGDSCIKCIAKNRLSEGKCDLHGITTFQSGACTICFVAKSISEKVCEVHGKTKHMGDVCATCTSQKSVNLKNCEIHGETKFQGTTCMKCNRQARLSPENRASNEKLDNVIDEIAKDISNGVLLKDIALKFDDNPRRITAAIKRSTYDMNELREIAKKNS